MKAKHFVLTAVAAVWLIGGTFAVRMAAGAGYLLAHKADPREAKIETWGEYWADYKDDPKEKKKLKGSMGVSIALIYGLPGAIMLARSSRRRSLHGDARWATRQEIEDAGLFGHEGIVLGKYGSRYLMMNDPKFVMLNAPTRSGKGVGTIIPNLLSWPGSVIALDVKEENFQITSGYRAEHGQSVFKFAPFDPAFSSHRWNPLSYVNRDPKFVVGDLQGLGYMIYPKAEGSEGFFNDQARNLFVAVSLYLMESKLTTTIGEVLRYSTGEGKPKEYWSKIADSGRAGNDADLSVACISALRQFVSNSDNTLTSILATFNAPLGAFSTASVDAATSADDFDLRDVRRRCMSIYICIPPNRLAEASLLVNLFFSIAIDQNTKELPEHNPELTVKCLLLMDEFPAIGRVGKYEKAIGYIAGYGLRALTIAQSKAQLKGRDLYGDEGTKALADNHLIKLLYAPESQDDANEYSETLGFYTEQATAKSVNYGKGPSSRGENTSDQKRALMMPQELRYMGKNKVVVLADNCLPIQADKICYYSDPVFTDRLRPPVAVPSLDVEGFVARIEGRVRETQPGEIPPPNRLLIDPTALPPVAKNSPPIPEQVAAMADFLFSHVKWTSEVGATA